MQKRKKKILKPFKFFGPGHLVRVEGVESVERVGGEAREVGLEVEPQTARGRVHLATEVAPEKKGNQTMFIGNTYSTIKPFGEQLQI